MPERLQIRGLRFTHPGAAAPCLVDTKITVAPSEMLYVLGPSGSGKSTLLRLMAGDLTPDAGEVRIDGRPASGRPGGAFPDVGYQGQFPERQFFASTVGAEVGYAGERLRERHDGRRPAGSPTPGLAVGDALELVGLPCSRADLERSPWSLSQGEQRRLALASVLVFEPGLVLLDEPTAALDRAGRESLASALTAVRNGGAAVVAAGHDLMWAAEAGAGLALLVDGEVRRVDPAREADRSALVAGGYEAPPAWGFFGGRCPDFWVGEGWRRSIEALAREWGGSKDGEAP